MLCYLGFDSKSYYTTSGNCFFSLKGQWRAVGLVPGLSDPRSPDISLVRLNNARGGACSDLGLHSGETRGAVVVLVLSYRLLHAAAMHVTLHSGLLRW